ncbi:MAG TPA: PD-(D/E)XK nuclease family protein [Myxococcales bacterium]|jgi:CRISPR/Cas system-associated exonuclease Cas4 (RecB family)
MKLLITSAGAEARLARARSWLSQHQRALVVAASTDAASEVARAAARIRGASFGWQRFTLARFAALVAAPRLAELGFAPLSSLGLLAVCTRIAHRLGKNRGLGRFEPLAAQPGLPRALARTLSEVRLAGARPGGDLGRILAEYEAELRERRLADRAAVFELATAAEHELFDLPALLLDLPLGGAVEARLLSRLRGEVLATAPSSDAAAVGAALGIRPEAVDEPRGTSLSRVQQGLFEEAGDGHPLGDDVVLLSAPGEARECVEIARHVLREAARGVPFDQMAVLLRAPSQYRPLLQEAFARAGVPVHFASGTLAPDPSGRAFLALLGCAAEGVSARGFAEYLSLGEVPRAVKGQPPAPPSSADRWVPPDAELSTRPPQEFEVASPPDELDEAGETAPVVEGTLRAPWRWEKLVVDAAVIGGADRWQRRLSGLEEQLRVQFARCAVEEARADKLRRDLSDLQALREFALPLVKDLAALPREAVWHVWLESLSALAARALRNPARVQSLLAELNPMAPVGPVSLAEVRLVLSRRLTELPVAAPKQRHGAVYVAETAGARGLSFEVVFVPGLAEKLFPQKVLEDPLLRDAERRELGGLEVGEERIAQERLALRLGVGAARRKAVLSWPRVDLVQGRARVPSFYGLEVLRAAEGKLPVFSELSRLAEEKAAARAGWPAPQKPSDAIDEAEHDLSLLAAAARLSRDESKGIASYLLNVNPHLERALRTRARRALRRWTEADGLIQLEIEPRKDAVGDADKEALREAAKKELREAGKKALREQLPSHRPYSPTALQNYSACPYKFVLQALHRLSPREVPEAVDQIDPLARGSLIHEVQFKLLRELSEKGLLPVDDSSLRVAQSRLEAVLAEVAAEYEDRLAPAIARVWTDCIAGVAVDLREWLRRMTEERSYTPWRFELSFGLTGEDTERDPHSTPHPVRLDDALLLRGSIDLVERTTKGELRATDYKTGKAWSKPGVVIGGGATLQPALYALALEKLFPGAKVEEGRLYYCTYTGDFSAVPVKLDAAVRGSVQVLAQTLTQAIERGFLPALPRHNQYGWECDRCDYLPVCGPGEPSRTARKPKDETEPLRKLRELP